ncbi:VOC family protein [Alteribacter natronophilus]|uniref:VOC family protein n=1 Tax=Alteribacter natronophilus TaxID=2583810 RepID=UPI00110E754D|nr:VOC family protein [Alteribacter natronophilus]TMW70753.1 VOC family protein [Alteribacter natronophilus]
MKSPVKSHIGGVFVMVKNMPRAVSWYRELLDLPADDAFTRETPEDIRTIYSLSMGKTDLILDSMHRDELSPSPNHLFYFDTDDIEETFDDLKRKNVTITSGIEGGNGVRFFGIEDPEGNRLMVCEALR